MMLSWMGLALTSSAKDLVAPLGTDDLSKVGELVFTVHIEVNGTQTVSRSWAWEPDINLVTLQQDDVFERFRIGAPQTEGERKAEVQFVDDLFWLLPQLRVRWASPALVVTDLGEVRRPIGAGTARQVELRYAAASGGSAPGDACELYLDAAGRVVVWSYRKGAEQLTLATSLADVGPLTVAAEHRDAAGRLRLFFTDVAVHPPRRIEVGGP